MRPPRTSRALRVLDARMRRHGSRGTSGRRLLFGLIRHGPSAQRRNLNPSFGEGGCLAHLRQELGLAVVMLPAPAAIKLKVVVAAALGEASPLQRGALPLDRSQKHGGWHLCQVG